MNWLDKLEKKFGRFAIPGLMTYIVGFNAVVYILSYVDTSGRLISKLMLEPSLVLRGEVWRLVTYIFIPPESSPIWIIFILYFYYLIGSSLEHEWGSFRFNMYYLLGMLGTTIGALITGGGTTATYLNLSLFLAFARLFPNYQILIFFVLPVKVKYLAWLDWAVIVFTLIFSPVSLKVAAIVSIINYFVFFGKEMLVNGRNNRTVYYNKRRFHDNIPKEITYHKCTICGRTEKDDPNLEFRYCITCKGDHEYCSDHLNNHEHIQ